MKNLVPNFFKLLSFLFLATSFGVNAQNLLTNGDFEGPSATGYNVNGNGYNLLTPPFTGATLTGDYAITTNPQFINTSNFISGGDHTTGNGNMMAVDGNQTLGLQRFWRAGTNGVGVCGLATGYTYTFSYYIESISLTTNASNAADIGIQIIGATSINLISGSATAPLPAAGWQKVTYTFIATASCVSIELYNNNRSAVGNDFAVDDFTLTAPANALSLTYSVVNASCLGTNDGSIAVYATRGSPPYTSYSLISPAITITNSTGAPFTGLTAGTYTISVKDSANSILTLNNVIVSEPTNLVVTPATSICGSTSTTLSAAGGGGSYSWTAIPVDPSLTIPNISNPIVSPLVNTTYTVTSATTGIKEYVYNGNFSSGNIGFATDYQYLAANTPVAQTTYGIVTNGRTWSPLLSNCGDHTTGTGKMMVVDGSTTNFGNNKVWSQNIAVTPNINYTFSYWIQTLVQGSTAIIDAKINGISIGFQPSPPVATCGNWTQFSYVWYSGTSSVANICLYDLVTVAPENDFALDDISFIRSTNCLLINTVSIKINTAAITSPATSICKGNSTIVTFLGTPNTLLNIVVNGSLLYAVPLNTAGIGTYSTNALLVDTTISLVNVEDALGCLTPVTGNVLITIAKNGCVTVLPGDVTTGGAVIPICNVGECRTLSANAKPVASTTAYTVAPIAYCPQFSFKDPTSIELSNFSGDDFWSPQFSLTPPATSSFNFCFFGTNYTNCWVGTNGVITFTQPNSLVSCPFDLNSLNIPNVNFPATSSTGNKVLNAIYGVYQDVITNILPLTSSPDSSVNYTVTGTYPCRKFVANFNELSQFRCLNSVGYQTSQIVLYEITNIIEIYVKKRTPCLLWQNGEGVLGIQNGTGTIAYTPPGLNTGAWTVEDKAYRFTPSGPAIPVTYEWFADGVSIGQTTPIVNVCPTTTKTYTVKATYDVCGIPKIVDSTIPTVVEVYPDLTSVPTNINNSINLFDLTSNQAVVLLGLPNATDYTLSFYQSNADAQAEINTILNPTTYSIPGAPAPTCQIIHVRITNANNDCVIFKQFSVCSAIAVCEIIDTPSPTQLLCLGATPTPISVNTTAVAVNSMKFVYFNTPQTGSAMYTGGTLLASVTPVANIASYIMPALGATSSLPNAAGTYYIYAISNPTPGLATCRPFQEIIIKVNPLPTGTIAISSSPVCLNSISPTVTFTGVGGTPPYIFNYTYNTIAATVSTTSTTSTITVNVPTNVLGLQTYVLTSIQDANCSNPQSGTVTTNVVPQANAGTSATAVLTATSTVGVSLFSFLTGSPQVGGVWARVSGSGGIFNAGAGTFAPTTIASTDVFSYTVPNSPCLPAFISRTVTITVNVTPIPINNPTALVVCDDNIVFDGVAGFNLHTKDLEVSVDPLVEIRYFYTQADAQIGANEILVNPFFNNNPSAGGSPIQVIYIRVNYISDPNGIYSITTLDLEVKPRPLLNLTLTPLQVCDSTLPTGSEPFDLHLKDADIINGQTGVVVNYFATQALAEANGTALLNQNSYLITPAALTQTIWYRASYTSSGCGTVGPLLLIVNPLPNATQPNYPAFKKCETSLVSDGLESFNLQNPTFIDSILLGQVGVSVKFYPSPADAAADTNVITAASIINNPAYVQTLGIRLTNLITGCFSLSSIDLIVNPLPAPVKPVLPYTVCDVDQNGTTFIDLLTKIPDITQGGNMTITFFGTQTDAENGFAVDVLPNPYLLLAPITTVYVRAVDNVTGCVKIISIQVEVNNAPTLPLTAPNLIKDLFFCDEDVNNQNGATTINLTTQTPLLLAVQPLAASNYVVTYYTTAADAGNSPVGLNPIVYPATFPGTNNQFIWVRIENIVTKCFKVEKFKLVINTPLLLTAPAPLSLCDDQPGVTNPAPTSPPQPATTIFDLVTLRNPTILVGALPANYTVNYYLTQADANAGSNVINAAAFVNTSNPQTLFVVVTSNNIPAGTGGCKSFTTLTLNVLPIPTPNFNPPTLGEKCDANTPNLTEEFNIATNATYIANNDPNVTLHYYPGKPPGFTNEYAVAGINEIPATELATAQVAGNVWIRVESNLVINSQSEKCYTLVEQKLKVNPLPTVSLLNATEHPLNTYQICQNSSLLAAAQFNLDSLIPELLLNNPLVPVTPPAIPSVYTNTYITTFYTTAAGASAGGATDKILNPTTYVSTAVVGIAQDIYVRVENEQTGCVNAKGTFKIIVNPKPTITLPTALDTCDTDGANDGFFAYPLNAPNFQTDILGTLQLPTDFTVTFHESQTDAIGGLNAVADLGAYMGYTHKLWIRVQNNNTKCFEVASSQQNVEMLPQAQIITDNNINSICVDYTNQFVIRPLTLKIKTPIIPQNANTPIPYSVSYQWYEGTSGVVAPGISTGPTYLVNQAELSGATRKYTVKITSSSSRGCSVTSEAFDVIQSGPAVKQPGTIGYEITNAFEDNQIITALVTGYGTYQYSLDDVDGVKQDSPVFENVPLGTHTIFVHDVKALSGTNTFNCEKLIIDGVQTIDYPHYFTPNGDGINDFWNISGLAFRIPTSTIYIFNRDGKLMKQISPDGNGWDGSFNNELAPSTDYWFTVDFTEKTIQKQFKSHFSLKR